MVNFLSSRHGLRCRQCSCEFLYYFLFLSCLAVVFPTYTPLAAAITTDDICGETALTIIIFVIGIALCSVFFVLFIITCFIGCCMKKGKSNSNAPSSSKNVSIVVADIDQSTLLWGLDRVRMAHAMTKYNSIVRGLLDKYGGYEWYCSGSGVFVMAFRSSTSAVKMAQHLQHRLIQEPIDNFFDNSYIHLEMKRQREDQEKLATSAFAPDYDLIWNGPRACIGLHSAEMDKFVDKASGNTDYWGPGVGVAYDLCEQAHGGQILMSHEFYEASFGKSKDLRKKYKVREPPYELCLPSYMQPTPVYELIAVSRREFPPFPPTGFTPLFEYVTPLTKMQIMQMEAAEKQKKKEQKRLKRQQKVEKLRSQRHRRGRDSDSGSDEDSTPVLEHFEDTSSNGTQPYSRTSNVSPGSAPATPK